MTFYNVGGHATAIQDELVGEPSTRKTASSDVEHPKRSY
jgi:hypothetical protein